MSLPVIEKDENGKTYCLSKEKLISIKQQLKHIMVDDVTPAYGDDAKAIKKLLDSLDITVDLYLARFKDD